MASRHWHHTVDPSYPMQMKWDILDLFKYTFLFSLNYKYNFEVDAIIPMSSSFCLCHLTTQSQLSQNISTRFNILQNIYSGHKWSVCRQFCEMKPTQQQKFRTSEFLGIDIFDTEQFRIIQTTNRSVTTISN